MMSDQTVRLTQFSKGSGCGCKIAPTVLEKIISSSAITFSDPNLLIGNESKDDAAVYDQGDGNCIISTTDFFTPIVDDAFLFGKIAAANAISDVYAMGGKPAMAIAILGWPVEKLDPQLAAKVLEGAREICSEANIALAGGHSIDIPEPVFGLAVTGLAKKEYIKKNNSGRTGDLIYLTKPIGSGVLSAALKRGVLKAEHETELFTVLSSLNKAGEILGKQAYVHAMTDVTGFGLLGHLTEMVNDTGLSAVIYKGSIPKITGFDEYAAQFIYPENTTRNYTAYSSMASGMTDLDFLLTCDPQTNGGLLIAVAANANSEFESLMNKNSFTHFKIGHFEEESSSSVVFVN